MTEEQPDETGQPTSELNMSSMFFAELPEPSIEEIVVEEFSIDATPHLQVLNDVMSISEFNLKRSTIFSSLASSVSEYEVAVEPEALKIPISFIMAAKPDKYHKETEVSSEMQMKEDLPKDSSSIRCRVF